eukprot:5865965-Prymnesium_polylepis.1
MTTNALHRQARRRHFSTWCQKPHRRLTPGLPFAVPTWPRSENLSQFFSDHSPWRLRTSDEPSVRIGPSL